MFYKSFFSLALILFMLIFSSCGEDRPCSEAIPFLNFISFPGAETDSVILRKYEKSSGFGSLVDSIVITRDNSIYQNHGDTLDIQTAVGGEYVLDIDYNYEVYMPLVNKLFQISDIVQEQKEIHAGISMDKQTCINPVKSYILNGQTTNGYYGIIFIKN